MSSDSPAQPNPVWTFVSEQVDLQLPDFTEFTAERLRDAGTLAVRHQQAGMESVLASAEDPTFTTTTLQLGWARYPAFRLAALIRVLQANVLTEEYADAVADVSAQLTAARLDTLLDAQLFARVEAVPTEDLPPEDRRHHRLLLEEFVRAGARLEPDDRSRAAAITAEIERLKTQYSRLLVEGSSAQALHFTEQSALAGLSRHALDAAARAAAQRGLPGWVLTLENTSQQSALEQLEEPTTRQALLTASLGRGAGPGPADTREIVSDISALRAALADLLSYRTFAAYAVDNETAGSRDAVGELLSTVLGPATARLSEELAELAQLSAPQPLEASDIVFWQRRLRNERFGITPAEIEPYFAYDTVLRDGVLRTARELYGIEFVLRPDLSGWHPDVQVFEAQEDSAVIGLVCVDAYAREGKSGGAWMDQLLSPGRLTAERPILTMSLNLTAPSAGAPALLSPDEVRTLFHEFGHVLHALVSDTTYPSQAGTAVPRDYVEFPSQLHEMWAFHPEVLPQYAVHWQTGERLPQELAQRIRASEQFGQGFATVEYLAAALLDQGWHSLEAGEQVADVVAFEKEVLAASGIDPRVPPRYRSTYFHHVFGSGYGAGYYSYLWSEVLSAQAAEWFDAHGGLTREAGDAFRRAILAPGNAVDPMSAFEDFLGAPPSSSALLRLRGLSRA